jgi:hypothetical protein
MVEENINGQNIGVFDNETTYKKFEKRWKNKWLKNWKK